MKQIDLTTLAEKWPSAIVSRSEISSFTGGLIKPATMRRLDKEVPRMRFNGQKIFYHVDDLLEYLIKHSEVIEQQPESTVDVQQSALNLVDKHLESKANKRT